MSLYKRYVDDGNVKARAVPPGYNWDNNSSGLILTMSPEDDTRMADERTASVFRDIANSISSMITWTVDFPSAHSDGKMPVLDLAIWCMEEESGTKTKYQFYMKPMSNLVSIPARSALSKSVKFATYRQETYRVLRNTSVDIPWEDKAELLSQLSWRMALSEYPEGFRSNVILGGLTGYLKTLKKSVFNGTPFHSSRQDISQSKRNKSSTELSLIHI